MQSDTVALELAKQLPATITAIGVLITVILQVVAHFDRKSQMLKIEQQSRTLEQVKHQTNALLDQRVDAAKAEGRMDQQKDDAARSNG